MRGRFSLASGVWAASVDAGPPTCRSRVRRHRSAVARRAGSRGERRLGLMRTRQQGRCVLRWEKNQVRVDWHARMNGWPRSRRGVRPPPPRRRGRGRAAGSPALNAPIARVWRPSEATSQTDGATRLLLRGSGLNTPLVPGPGGLREDPARGDSGLPGGRRAGRRLPIGFGPGSRQ